jgi:imidazolonepropionase-like amidohydrolase
MRPISLLLLSSALVSSPLIAQTSTPSAAPAQPDTIIHAGTLLDRPGKDPRRNASILIAKGKIVSVQDGFAKPPQGATVIDLKDCFVLPGLIDCHVHLTSDRAGVEGQLAGVTDSAARRSYKAAWNGRKTLDAGFTTVRNLGSSDGVTLALRDAIAKDGRSARASSTPAPASPPPRATWIRASVSAMSSTTCLNAT